MLPTLCRLVLFHTISLAHALAPFYANEPLLPNDTALLTGYFSPSPSQVTISLCSSPSFQGGSSCITPTSLLPTATAIKFTLPETLPRLSTYTVTLTSPLPGLNYSTILNLPKLDWYNSEGVPQGQAALNRPLRFFGRGLAWDPVTGSCPPLLPPPSSPTPGAACVMAVPQGTPPTSPTAVRFPVLASSCFRVDALLPPSGTPGGLAVHTAYDFYISSGVSGEGMVPSNACSATSTTPAALLATLTVVPDPALALPPAVFTLGSTPGCTSVGACLALAGAAGGGTVSLPPGTLYMSGQQVLFPPNATISLVGAGAGVGGTVLEWQVGGSLPPSPAATALVTGNGTRSVWSLVDLTLAVYTGATGGPQSPGNAMPLVAPQSGSTGVRLTRVALISDLTRYPAFAVGNPLRLVDSTGFVMEDSSATLVGNCAAQWPKNTGLSIHNSTDVTILRSNFSSICQGWVITSSARVAVVGCAFESPGDVSQGSSFGTDGGAPGVAEHLYWGGNTDTGNAGASMRWETFTSDGPGGQYNSTAVGVGSHHHPTGGSNSSSVRVQERGTVTLSSPPACRLPLAQGCLYPGTALTVLRGPGAGQWRRIVGVEGDGVTVVLESPLDPPPALGPPGDPSASFISITGLTGQATFEGNRLVNGTVFQTYGFSMDLIVAGNEMREMFDNAWQNVSQVSAGVRLFGHRYVGGYEANWHTLFEANTLVCATQFMVYADNITGVLFSMGHVVRRNVIAGGMNVSVNFLRDGVVEGNLMQPAACEYAGGATLPAGGVIVNASSTGVVVRQ